MIRCRIRWHQFKATKYITLIFLALLLSFFLIVMVHQFFIVIYWIGFKIWVRFSQINFFLDSVIGFKCSCPKIIFSSFIYTNLIFYSVIIATTVYVIVDSLLWVTNVPIAINPIQDLERRKGSPNQVFLCNFYKRRN